MTDSKYMKPSCRSANWSAAVAPSVSSGLPTIGWPQAGPCLVIVVRSLAGWLPMSCR